MKKKANLFSLKPVYHLHGRKVWIFPIILLFIIHFISCHLGKDKKNITTSQAAIFKPNPQKITKQEVKTLEIGAEAPDFKLPDITGKFYSLKDFEDAKILVIIFTCNHCPTAQAYEDRIIQFTKEYKDKGVSVVAIMPNSTITLLLEECSYSDLGDSYEDMIIRAKDKSYNFPYLYDGDNEAVSTKYGPTATPHAFVFNNKRKLCYAGRIDASEKPGSGHGEDIRAAVDAVLTGKKVENPTNKAFGCSIKWSWKSDWTDKVNKDWDERPVNIEKIDKSGIKKLIKNDSEKLKLINVWAIWCGPCVIEYPELIKLQRIYGNRSFEFISLSADKPEKTRQVLEFLKTKHSAIKNYIFNSDNKYELIESIDPKWNGALPYTMLVEPGGKVVYSIQGMVDLLELKRKIVKHPLIGRYY